MILSMWLVFQLVHKVLKKFSAKFRRMQIRHQHNVVTYIVETVITTAALILVLAWGSKTLFLGQALSTEEVKITSYSLVLIATLYTCELLYRVETNLALATHHVVAVGYVIIIQFTFYDSAPRVGYPSALELQEYVRVALLLALHAVTEQPSFIALIMHRFSARGRAFMFQLAAVLAIVIKTAVFIFSFVLYGNYVHKRSEIRIKNNGRVTQWHSIWTVLFPIMNLLLYVTQVYACLVLYSLGRKPPNGVSAKTPTKDKAYFGSRKLSKKRTKLYVKTANEGLTLEEVDYRRIDEDERQQFMRSKHEMHEKIQVASEHSLS